MCILPIQTTNASSFPTPYHNPLISKPTPPHELFHEIVNPVAAFTVATVACVLPLGTAPAYQFALPPYANSPPSFANTPALVTELPHTRLLLCTAHFPLLDVSVKPLPEAAAVNVAHVPPMYQVPAEMMQPLLEPEDVTWRVPLPEKGVPGAVVGGVPPVVVVVGEEGGVPDLGRYFTPVAGQLDFEPSGG